VARSALLVTAGGLSGAVAKSATAPLERAKILSQAGNPGDFIALMREVVRSEGWGGLWRGNWANVLRVIPNKGVLLMCSDIYAEALRPFALSQGWSDSAISSLSGAVAGMTSVLLTYPLELCRTRMAFRVGDSAYTGILATLLAVVKAEGLLGLYNGVGATLMSSLPFEGLKFGIYTSLKKRLQQLQQKRLASNGGRLEGRAKRVGWHSLVAGGIAGAVAHALTQPLDTVRRRMQVSGARGAEFAYPHMLGCVQDILRSPNPLALFFSGITATLVRSVPNLGIQFFLYEIAKSALELGGES
tara:strand:- start:806 stop:1708 length:903 start_codon:yes stop_codon:yes gene_type:complete